MIKILKKYWLPLTLAVALTGVIGYQFLNSEESFGATTQVFPSQIRDLGDITAGDLIFATTTTEFEKLDVGADGQVLKLSGGLPSWGTDNTGAGGSAMATDFEGVEQSADTTQQDWLIEHFNITEPSADQFKMELQATTASTTVDTLFGYDVSGVKTDWFFFGNGISATATTVNIDHDAADNFVANEHIDHTSVTLTAGYGLTGGGDISANRTFEFASSTALTMTANITAPVFIGQLTGNASTSTALAANGGNCAAGSAPLGVDTLGAAESCTDFEEDLSNEAGLYAALSDVSLFLEDLIDDTTPQLGGNLDLNSSNVTGTGAWQGTAIAAQYGGTGLDTSSTATGVLLYTSAPGTWAELAASATAGHVLTASTVNGSIIPQWSASSGGAETNSLETTITGILDTEIFIGNGADSGTFATISGDATLANTGALTVVDLTCTDCINATEIEDLFALHTGDAYTGTHNFSSASTTMPTNALTLGTNTIGNYVATAAGDSSITVSGSGSETAAVTLGVATSTNFTWTGTHNYTSASTSLPTSAIDALAEITASLKSGADATLITGTAGSDTHCAQWNADGDLVTSGATCGGGSSLFTDGGLLTYLTSTTDDIAFGASASSSASFWHDVNTGNTSLTGKIIKGTNTTWGLNMTGNTNTQTNIGQWTYVDSATGAAGISAYTARGSEGSPAASQADDWLMANTGRGHDGSSFSAGSKGRFVVHAGENWTATSQGTYITLWTTDNASTTAFERFRVQGDGTISMDGGTTGISSTELNLLDGLSNTIVTDNTAVTSVDGRSLTIASGTLDTDVETYTWTKNFVVDPDTDAAQQISFQLHGDATVTRFNCHTDTGTAEIRIDERDDGAPRTASTSIFNGTSAPCSTGNATTTFANASYFDNNYFFATVTATTSSPNFLHVTLEGTYND